MTRHAAARRSASCQTARGMTLIELMVGLAVGLFVSLIAIAVFVSTRTLNVVSNSSARLGENARLAVEALQEDLRHAGFQGCHHVSATAPVSVLNSPDAEKAGFLDTGINGVAGHRGTGTGFAPVLGQALDDLKPKPNNNSDIVTVRVPADNLSLGLTAMMASVGAAPQLGTGGTAVGTLRQNDIALIASCKAAAIFQITADPAATGALAHAAGTSSVSGPGNATANLPQQFGDDAAVYRLQTRHYYVAQSVLHAGSNALWRFRVPCPNCTDNPQELAGGVDRLNVLWGVDTDGDQTVNQYLSADAVTAWDRVASARVQMLVATTSNSSVTQSAQTVSFAGTTITPTDRQLRTVLTEVVTLRNRAP